MHARGYICINFQEEANPRTKESIMKKQQLNRVIEKNDFYTFGAYMSVLAEFIADGAAKWTT
jgi:ATP-dependent Clp protease adapter protein ClpS